MNLHRTLPRTVPFPLLTLLAVACHRQPTSDVPSATTLCDLVRRAGNCDGRIVRVHSRVESDGIEHTALTDVRCGSGIAVATVTKTASEEVYRVIYRTGLSGTLDKIVTGTFVGRFHYEAGKRPERWIELESVSDLRVEMVPVPAKSALSQ